MRINRKNDSLFKWIFGQEENKDILALFLSDVTGVQITPEELTHIKIEYSPDIKEGRTIMMDIQVGSSKTHDKMNIEMQLQNQGDIDRRILYHWGKAYTSELKEGQHFKELSKQIIILIADFKIFDWQDPKKFHGVFHVREKDEMTLFSEVLEIHVLELPKARDIDDDLLANPITKWMLYFNNAVGDIMQQIAYKEPILQKAITLEEIFLQDDAKRRGYDLSEKLRRDNIEQLIYAEDKGREEGREEEKIEIARNLLAEKMSIEFVSKITGLSLEDLKKIQQ